MEYYVVYLSYVDSSKEDEISGLCFEHGASGVEERLSFEQNNERYEPQTLSKELTELKVYFEKKPAEGFFNELQSRFPGVSFKSEVNQNKDWLEEWKKGFEPFALHQDVWVVPSWRTAPAAAKRILKIDPGMAFGTGTHETTALAAKLMGEHWPKLVNNPSVLDVGTGTGILAFMAELLGAKDVYANDIDPEARRVARENSRVNKSAVVVLDEDISAISGKYDWVVANIIDGVLVDIQNHLKSRVAEKGFLLLTGILIERESSFKSKFNTDSWELVDRKENGEWMGLLLRKLSNGNE